MLVQCWNTLTCLLAHDVKVDRETLIRIRHNLIVIRGADIIEIDRVFSHPVALAQCRRFLAEHRAMRATAFYDTAGSVKHIVEQHDRRAAAIASEAAAKYFGAQILQGRHRGQPGKLHALLSGAAGADSQADPEANKISLAFSVENRPGSLVAVLNELAALGTNFTKIESRPVHGKPWEYIFYVDCQIHSSEESSLALDALKRHCAMVKELGRYKEAEM